MRVLLLLLAAALALALAPGAHAVIDQSCSGFFNKCKLQTFADKRLVREFKSFRSRGEKEIVCEQLGGQYETSNFREFRGTVRCTATCAGILGECRRDDLPCTLSRRSRARGDDCVVFPAPR